MQYSKLTRLAIIKLLICIKFCCCSITCYLMQVLSLQLQFKHKCVVFTALTRNFAIQIQKWKFVTFSTNIYSVCW